MANQTLEIRGQSAADWQDVYEMRRARPGMLSLVLPDRVQDELAEIREGTWPLVALSGGPESPKVIARVMISLGRGRRGHSASFEFEHHPGFSHVPLGELLQEAINVAENWWNRHRLDVVLLANDAPVIALFESFGFVQEARLRASVRVAGELVDEVMLARITGDIAQRPGTVAVPPRAESGQRDMNKVAVTVRGASRDDWEAYHAIWSQPSVIWGTMQLPHTSADWNKMRVQERAPESLWRLVAEVDGQVVGISGLYIGELNRSHVGHIGMMVDTAYQGRGVGSALVSAAADLAENWLGLTRIQLEVYPDNAPAVALYERFDFEYEGLLRALSYRDGEYVDAAVMARLKLS